ncbi:DUF2510 domain-containing protein [Amycolatopsis sp. cmx-8-4]|uniref:DUF2510 domain-containing protein n=1 Tax=Amycolatopsis sp. cmx-8-4 TaxID=2790947 RepID=UPI00397B0C0F
MRVPEGSGAIQRRVRLFAECARRLADEPLASPDAREAPIGEGLGLGELIPIIEPVFEREPSMIRWAALRGALTVLYIETYDRDSPRVPFYPTVEMVMGVGLLSPPDDPQEVFGVGTAWSNRLTEAQHQAVLDTYNSVRNRLLVHEHYSKMSLEEINTKPRLRVGPAVGLEIITWVAVAFSRLERDFDEIPGPDALEAPGWYPEPVTGRGERYWDGDDWTGAVRGDPRHPLGTQLNLG